MSVSQWEVKGELESCIQLEAGEHDFILEAISQTSGLSLVIVADHLLSLIVPLVL